MSDPDLQSRAVGPIAWMARNPVAANLLMLTFVIGGLLMLPRIKKEVFPVIELDTVQVTVPYPGASPTEVEQGIVLAIEQAIRGLDGIERVTSRANEGVGTVSAEILLGADEDRVLQDIKSAVDRIVTFPEEAERPIVSLLISRREVVSIILHGDVDEATIRDLAERTRDEIEAEPNITQVTLAGVRPLEISIEVPESRLRAHGLTLGRIAEEVNRATVESGGGGIKTPAGEILLRTNERKERGLEFLDLPVVTRPDGSSVKLHEIADIRDGFSETDEVMLFNGRRAARLVIYSVGEESPNDVAASVNAYVNHLRPRLPPSVEVTIWGDRSELYRDRMSLLVRNGMLGLVLVMITLGLFLEVRLAFWVMLGIPTSFLGCLLFLPATDVSINMVSLFAFIITLGIVVDDATVVGESVYYERQKGHTQEGSAIRGARLVAGPVVFSVLTNIIAFIPLLFIPGTMGQLWRSIPLIVTLVFSASLVESLYILPAHLAHQKKRMTGWIWRVLEWPQEKVGRGLDRFVQTYYRRFVARRIDQRYLTVSIGVAVLILGYGWLAGGRMPFIFFPKVESDNSTATAVLPYGVPLAQTEEVTRRILDAARAEIEARGGSRVLRGILTSIGSNGGDSRSALSSSTISSGSHLATITVSLVPGDERDFGAADFTEAWRRRVGEIPGLESLSFRFTLGPSQSRPIDIALSHTDPEVIEKAALRVADALGTVSGVIEIDDGIQRGKPQYEFRMTDLGRSLGLTAAELARQVRNAFYGAEARRQQRGRNEMRIYVRRPLAERQTEHTIETLLLRTPTGGEIAVGEAARVSRSRAYEEIKHTDGRRVISVTADIQVNVTDARKVLDALEGGVLARLHEDYPGLTYTLEGEQRDQRRAFASIIPGFGLVLFGLFAMLAIPFRSYVQALIILIAIPFGMLGAFAGHLIMGYQLSFVSIMGMMALAGVVINDSILLLDAGNQFRAEGNDEREAMILAPVRRFRPVLLTSLTTFFGLAPMILERSVQARFMIPMALSLGFGILFSTGLSLILLPSICMIVEDIRGLFRRIFANGGDNGSAT
jgi:multidrug efflux pump subunit AcrB